MIAAAIGYAGAVISFAVLCGVLAQSQGPDAGLADLPDRRLETVVTGSRTERKLEDVVVPTEVITRPQIEQLGVRDLTQLMQQQQGVELVYTNRGVGMRLQGLDPEYVLILIDGQRVAGRAGSFTDISRFSLREVERIELVKGPAAALYGADAIGGVVNLITRRPMKALEGSTRGSVGVMPQRNAQGGVDPKLEGEVRAHLGSKLGSVELRGGGGYRTRDSYDLDPRDAASSGPGIRRIDGDADVSWSASERFRAWARTAYVFTDLGAVDINDSGAVFDRWQRTEQLDVWGGARGSTASGASVTGRVHFGLFRDQFLVDQRGSRALDEYSATLTRMFEGYGQAEFKVGDHSLTGGVEGLLETLSSTRNDPSSVARGRVGAFVQDTWTPLGQHLAVEPGLRGDLDSQFGGAVSPRLAVKIDPVPSVTFRASAGMGFRPPSFSELYLRFSNAGIGYIVQGNRALASERSGSVAVAVDWRPPWAGSLVSASAWHTSLSNLINVSANGIPDPDNPVVFGYENVANAFTQGVELTARAKLSRGAFLEVGYMGLDARDVTRNRPLEGRAAHRVTVQATGKYRPSGLEAVVRASYSSPRPYYVGSGLGFANVLGFGEERVAFAPPVFDLEAQLTWTFRGWLKIFVNGFNLLNAGDKDFNPRPPRGVLGGVQVDY